LTAAGACHGQSDGRPRSFDHVDVPVNLLLEVLRNGADRKLFAEPAAGRCSPVFTLRWQVAFFSRSPLYDLARFCTRRRRQLTEACGWNEPPRYVVRDRDGVYGDAFIRRLRAMGIRDQPASARSPWQNGYAERLIGSIRRDCLDHVVVFGERHLRHLLNSYEKYYNQVRTLLYLHKDAPIPRDVCRTGRVLSLPVLGGLHHQYVRV